MSETVLNKFEKTLKGLHEFSTPLKNLKQMSLIYSWNNFNGFGSVLNMI